MGKFKDLSLVDKCRIYAYCYGNVMLIAEYLNRECSNDSDRVTYLDVKEDLESEDEDVLRKLGEALLIRMDYIAKRNLGQGNMMYDLKIIEKLHPEYRKGDSGGNSVKIDNLYITLEHIKNAERKLRGLRGGRKNLIEGGDAEKKEGRGS